jgi:ribosomal protein S6
MADNTNQDQRTYELTCLIPVGYTKSELDEIQQELGALLEKQGAEIEAAQSWGKKELAYSIKHSGRAHKEAYYLHWVFASDPQRIADIKQQLRLKEKIIRQLLVAV